ncbi:IS1595 family transposase [Marinomonas sp.]|nr:IS1595 family transposase [Marinomonas sp.]MDB4837335.1 IS1595 family transposase [Marinomonas sp.]
MRKSKLSWCKQSKLIELFVAGTTVRTAASLVGVNKTTESFYFQRLRQLIYNKSEHHELLEGEVEAGESYFGGRCKGKRGRGAAGKVPVFGLLRRNGKVYTVVIPDANTEALILIVREKINPDSIVYTDTWRSYNVLDLSEFKHYRINHSKLFANKTNHINGVENFWNQAKCHMRKFNGLPRELSHLLLKESEWRFDNSYPKGQLKSLN